MCTRIHDKGEKPSYHLSVSIQFVPSICVVVPLKRMGNSERAARLLSSVSADGNTVKRHFHNLKCCKRNERAARVAPNQKKCSEKNQWKFLSKTRISSEKSPKTVARGKQRGKRERNADKYLLKIFIFKLYDFNSSARNIFPVAFRFPSSRFAFFNCIDLVSVPLKRAKQTVICVRLLGTTAETSNCYANIIITN